MINQTANYPILISENNVSANVPAEVEAMVVQTEDLSVVSPRGEEIFYKSAEFWVGFAFILVVVFLFKPLKKAIKSMLLKRRGEIIDQISQAEQLRDDAQKLLAQYEKKFLHAKDEADEILKRSEKEIETLKNEELQKLEQDLEIRRKEVENSINLSIEKVKNEINQKIAELTMQKVKNHIYSDLSEKDHEVIIDKSLDELNHKILKIISTK